jgi:hypothetical protein
MAHNLTDVDTFTSAVTVPDGGDARTAASVEVPFQALSNRSRNNKNRIDGIGVTSGLVATHASGIQARAGDVRAFGDFAYCDAAGALLSKPKTIMLPLSSGFYTEEWEFLHPSSSMTAKVYGADAVFPLPVCTGQRITLVRVGHHYFGGGGTPPSFTVYRRVVDKATPNIGTSFVEVNVTGVFAPAPTPQVMTSGPISTSVVNRALEDWRIQVRAGAQGDNLFWIEITVSDPGPRNF